MAIPDQELATAVRTLLAMNAGFHIGLAGMLEIGQLENLRCWVEWKDHRGNVLWEKDDLEVEDAIAHFLRIRREQALGFDIEIDINRGARHIGPHDDEVK